MASCQWQQYSELQIDRAAKACVKLQLQNDWHLQSLQLCEGGGQGLRCTGAHDGIRIQPNLGSANALHLHTQQFLVVTTGDNALFSTVAWPSLQPLHCP